MKNSKWAIKGDWYNKNKLLIMPLILLVSIFLINEVMAVPAGPSISYLSNSTASSVVASRTADTKGSITTLNLSLVQQDYKWKAYVGNVTGRYSLDDANAKTIYDWSLTSITGEVYVTRSSSSVSWSNVDCVNQSVINSEETALGFNNSLADSINKTFSTSVHKSFIIGTTTISNSSCRAIHTYINDTSQTSNESAFFQEILLRDNSTGALIYSTILEQDHLSYDGGNQYDFQLIVAENESNSIPLTYYFYVELG